MTPTTRMPPPLRPAVVMAASAVTLSAVAAGCLLTHDLDLLTNETDAAVDGRDGGPVGGPFVDDFSGPAGLVTNEYATKHPEDSAAHRSPLWSSVTGSLFRTAGGAGWTGAVQACTPVDRDSTGCTNSADFLAVTKRTDFENVDVAFTLVNNALTSANGGVFVLLRYRPDAYYGMKANVVVSGMRLVRIVKLCHGVEALMRANSAITFELGTTQAITTYAQTNGDGSVLVGMTVGRPGGGQRIEAMDAPGGACPPIVGASAVGIRGMDDDFTIDDLSIRQR